MFSIYHAQILTNILQIHVLLLENIYLALTQILSTNVEQAHHTLVSYLKVEMIRSGVVCLITDIIGC